MVLKSKQYREKFISDINMPKEEAIELCKEGNTQYDQKKYWKAITIYNNAIEMDPTYKWPWCNKGLSFVMLARSTKKKKYLLKAIEPLEKAVEIDPHFIEALLQLVSVYAGLKDTQKMVEYFKQAEKVDPNHPQVKKSAKDFHEMERLRDETIKQYEEILDIAKKNLTKKE